MEELLKDLRHSARALGSNLGFSIVAIITLALGIGVNTALFSVVNGVLLRPLTFPHADRLVTLYENRANFPEASISYPNYLDWKRESNCFQALAAFRAQDFTVVTRGHAERLRGEMVSAGFFRVLGVPLVLGRDLDVNEDHPGGRPEALISEGLWRRMFNGSQDVLGKPLRMNGRDYSVAGVVPSTFQLELENFQDDFYVPIGQWNDALFRMRNAGLGTKAIGRLKNGITFEQARANMNSVAHALAAEYPADDSKVGVTMVPLKDKIVGDVRPYLLVLLGAVFFVLLISCINVANLQLARSMSRSREFAIRLALGARKLRIVRQLLTESVFLSLCGGALGLILASWGTRMTVVLLGDRLPRREQIGLDGRVLLFTLGISLLAGILFGLAPALKSLKADLQNELRDGGRGATAARSRAQRIFVTVEMAMALVLLVAAGLMVRSLFRLWRVDPGFEPKNVLVFQVSMPPSLKDSPAATLLAEFRQLHQEIASVPGVLAVSLQRGGLPMYGDSDDPFWIAGHPKPTRESEMPWGLWYDVEPDYFKAMRIPLKRGRLLTAADDENARPVTVIDEALAAKYFPNQDPIGKSIVDEFLGRPVEIVGIVGHVKQWGLDDKTDLHAEFYIPYAQIPAKSIERGSAGTGVVVRTAGPPLATLEAIRKRISDRNGEEIVFDPHSYEEIVGRSLRAQSFSMTLLAVFAGLALMLASIGIYGVVSYIVGQRTHEIGIRMALGARPRDVLGVVMGEGARTALWGVAAGVLAALGLTQLMGSVVYGVSVTDPVTFLAVPIFLTCVALAASYVPALRATRVDPVITLRYE